MFEIVKMVKSEQGVSITELDEFSYKSKEDLLIAQNTLKDILRPSLILHNWTVAFSFFCDNIPRLLNSKTAIRNDYIIYQLKIVLNAGLEFSDTLKRYLSHLYPQKITKETPQNKKPETHSEGEWIFKELSAKIYDKNFSYRLCYNLRNCLQHVGAEGIFLEHSENGYRIMLNILSYAEGHDGIQSNFRKELVALSDEKIDLFSTIKSYNKNISELFKSTESVYKCKNLTDELYSSLIIAHQLPLESDMTRYAILHKNCETKETNILNCKIDYFQVKRATEFIEMHCKYYLLQGNQIANEIADQCPYQIDELTFYAGSDRFAANGMTYIKIDEYKKENEYYVIYSLECLFAEERLAILSAIKKFIID